MKILTPYAFISSDECLPAKESSYGILALGTLKRELGERFICPSSRREIEITLSFHSYFRPGEFVYCENIYEDYGHSLGVWDANKLVFSCCPIIDDQYKSHRRIVSEIHGKKDGAYETVFEYIFPYEEKDRICFYTDEINYWMPVEVPKDKEEEKNV